MNIIYDKVTYVNRQLGKNLLGEFLSKASHILQNSSSTQSFETTLLTNYP